MLYFLAMTRFFIYLTYLLLPILLFFAHGVSAQNGKKAPSSVQAQLVDLHIWRFANREQALFYDCALAFAHEQRYRQTTLGQRAQLQVSADSVRHYYRAASARNTRSALKSSKQALKTLFGTTFSSPAELQQGINASLAHFEAYQDSVVMIIGKVDKILARYRQSCQLYQSATKGFKDGASLYLNKQKLSLGLLDSVRQVFSEIDQLLVEYQQVGQLANLKQQTQKITLIRYKGSALNAAADCGNTYSTGQSELFLLDFRPQIEIIFYKVRVQLPALRKGFGLADQLLNKALARYYAPNSAKQAGLVEYRPTLERQIVDSLRLFDNNSLIANLLTYKIVKLEALHAIYQYQRARAAQSLDLGAQYKWQGQIVSYLANCDTALNKISLDDNSLAHYSLFLEQPTEGKASIGEFVIMEKQQISSLLNGWKFTETETFAQLKKLGQYAAYGSVPIALYVYKDEMPELLAKGWFVSLHTHELPKDETFVAGYHQGPGKDRTAFVAHISANGQVKWLTEMPNEQLGAPKQLFVVLDQQGGACLSTRNQANQSQSMLLNQEGKKMSTGQLGIAAVCFNPQSVIHLQIEHSSKLRCNFVNALGQTVASTEFAFAGSVIGVVPDGDGFALVANFTQFADATGRPIRSEAFRVNGTNVILLRLGAQGQLREVIPFPSHNTLFGNEIFQTASKTWVVKGWQASDPMRDPATEQATPWSATFKTK